LPLPLKCSVSHYHPLSSLLSLNLQPVNSRFCVIFLGSTPNSGLTRKSNIVLPT
jgi:hypothetical protein